MMTGDTTADERWISRNHRAAFAIVAVVCLLSMGAGLTAAQSVSYEESWNVSGATESNAVVHDNHLYVSNETADTITRYDRDGNVEATASISPEIVSGTGAQINRDEDEIYVVGDPGTGNQQIVSIDANTLSVTDVSAEVDVGTSISDMAFDGDRDLLYFVSPGVVGQYDADSRTVQSDEVNGLSAVAVGEGTGTAHFYGNFYVEYDPSFTQTTSTGSTLDTSVADAEMMQDRDTVILSNGTGSVLSINPDDVTDREELFQGATPDAFQWDVIDYQEGTDIISWHDDTGTIGYYNIDGDNRTVIDTGTGYDMSSATWNWETVGIAYTGDGIAAYELNASGITPPGDSEDLRLDVPKYLQHNASSHYSVEANQSGTWTDVTDSSTVTPSNTDALTFYPSNNTVVAGGNKSINEKVGVTAEYQGLNATGSTVVATPTVDNLDLLPAWWSVNALLSDWTVIWILMATLIATAATRMATTFAGIGAFVMAMVMGWIMGDVPNGIMVATTSMGIFIGLNLAANIDYSVR